MSEVITMPAEPRNVDFYFDVLCPWAWRTSLWMREVARLQPVTVTWRQFSLAIVNKAEPGSELMQRDLTLGRLFIVAERVGGNEAVDGLYLALGDAIHGRKVDPLDQAMLRAALDATGLPPELLETAQSDETADKAYRASHDRAVAHDAFGVPTLVFDGREHGMFGPVVDPIPTGAEALELWRTTTWMYDNPFMWEFKKSRAGHKLSPQPATGTLAHAP